MQAEQKHAHIKGLIQREMHIYLGRGRGDTDASLSRLLQQCLLWVKA